MVTQEQLNQIPFFDGLAGDVLEKLARSAGEIQKHPGDVLVQQHNEARYFYFLLSGSVQFFVRFEGVGDLFMGASRDPGMLIGWSAFRIPYRYTATIRCETECRFLCISRQQTEQLMEAEPKFGYQFLRRVASTLADRLEQTRDLLVAPGELMASLPSQVARGANGGTS